MQVLAEHAYTLYLGGRLPPDLWGGYDWPEEFAPEPKPEYLSSPFRQFSVRIPRALHRRIRVWAVKAELSDQDLAVRVFDWYVRKDLLPPYRGAEKRGERGELLVDGPMIADQFSGYSTKQIYKVLEIMVDRHTKYGGPLSHNPTIEGDPPSGKGSPSNSTKTVGAKPGDGPPGRNRENRTSRREPEPTAQ